MEAAADELERLRAIVESVDTALDAMRTTARLFALPDGHLLRQAERGLEAAVAGFEEQEQADGK